MAQNDSPHPPIPQERPFRSKRFSFLGCDSDQLVKAFFGGNAFVALVILALITIFLFREGWGFFAQHQQQIKVYRLSGIEYVDTVRAEKETLAEMGMFVEGIRARQARQHIRDFRSDPANREQYPDLATLEDVAVDHAYASIGEEANAWFDRFGTLGEPLLEFFLETADAVTVPRDQWLVNRNLEDRMRLLQDSLDDLPDRIEELRKTVGKLSYEEGYEEKKTLEQQIAGLREERGTVEDALEFNQRVFKFLDPQSDAGRIAEIRAENQSLREAFQRLKARIAELEEKAAAMGSFLESRRKARLEAELQSLRERQTTQSEELERIREHIRQAEKLASLKARENLSDAQQAAFDRLMEAQDYGSPETRFRFVDFEGAFQQVQDREDELFGILASLEAQLREMVRTVPDLASGKLEADLAGLGGRVEDYAASLRETRQKLMNFERTEPVGWASSLIKFIFGTRWITNSSFQDFYGIVPLLSGSLLISAIALVLAVPFGVGMAIYVNQIASPKEREIIKPSIEFIQALPSVVLGLFGVVVFGTFLRNVSELEWLAWVPGFPMAERLTALTAGCLLALMAVPTIFSLAEDALQNVPNAFKEASLAMGATRFQTIARIIVPSALSGIISAILLGFGRVIGETMVVLLVAGNTIQIPGSIFDPVHTMTGIIAQEIPEVPGGTIHYRALFCVGIVLFFFSLLINYLAQQIVRKFRIAEG